LPQRPPVPVLAPKSVSGSADASALNVCAPAVLDGESERPPSAPKYHVRALVCGTGNDEKLCSKPANGSPAAAVIVGPPPAPLSKSTRTSGSFSNAASAAAYVGLVWIGSGGNVTTSLAGRPIACWKMTGAAACVAAAVTIGACFATYRFRKSNQRS